MDENELSNMIKKAQEMINNNQIPEELKGLINNMNNSINSNNIHKNINSNTSQHSNLSNRNTISNSTTDSNHNYYNKYANTYSRSQQEKSKSSLESINFSSNESSPKPSDTSGFSDLDIETILKLQSIMNKLKSNNTNDDMSKLLLSLKPYLRNEKKEKVDEYIKLIKMGKMTQLFNTLGGDKK